MDRVSWVSILPLALLHALAVAVYADRGTTMLTDTDPCTHHTDLNDTRRSTGYRMDQHDTPLCDMALVPGWYRFPRAGGGSMPEHCAQRFQCGTVMPVWLNGKHPSVNEGMVSRKACVNYHQGGCCEHSVIIGVKNCGHFYTYYLKPTPTCYMAYCGGTKTPCAPGQTSQTGFEPCTASHPEDSEDVPDVQPTLSNPVVQGNSFHFNCDIPHHATNNAGLKYEVQWTFNGQADPLIPNMVLGEPDRQATLPGTSVTGHLNSRLGCKVRSWNDNRPQSARSPWVSSNTYWLGIKVSPDELLIKENGNSHTISVTSTIPVLCDHNLASSCCIFLALDIDGPKTNVVVPHPCRYALCRKDWDPASHTASVNVTVVGAKDQIKDGNKNVLLSFEKLAPGGGGPYLDVFNGYRIPSVPLTVTDEETMMCYLYGDPHFLGFSKQSLTLLDVGDYTLYENKDDRFEMQSRTIRCNGHASCQCGLALREHSDVIRINNCFNRRAAPRIETANQPLREGTVIQRSNDGRNIMIYFPSGREVKVDTGSWSLNTHLTVTGSDRDHGRGICGTVDSRSDNEFTHRNGHVDQVHSAVPRPFTESWRNNPADSLFEHMPADLLSDQPDEVRYCQCDVSGNQQARINCNPGADITHHAQQCGSNHCPDVTANVPAFLQGGWTRRDVVYVDQDQPDPPVNFTDTSPKANLTWPTLSGITEQQAIRRCRSAIMGSQLYKHCQNHEHMDLIIDGCVVDVLYGDGFHMMDGAIIAFTSSCQFQLRQNPDNYVVSPDGTLTLKAEFSDVCSHACLSHGHCVNGTCVCDVGYTGDSCRLLANEGPVLRRIRDTKYCDFNLRPCRTIYIDADNFEMGAEFKCRVQALLAGGSQAGSPLEDKAQFISSDRLACTLPSVAGLAMTNFTVSVTYDGRHYSNELHMTVYDSTCRACDDSGCIQQPDTCLIDNHCHQSGDHKSDDANKICDTSVSISQWTDRTSSGSYPVISAPVLSGPTQQFNMQCSVQHSGHEPNARFQVTWYANDTVIGQETMAGDSPVALKNLFNLPTNVMLQCRVTSFYDGKNVFSPVVSSGSYFFASI